MNITETGRNDNADQDGSKPMISVVVPGYNEENIILESLNELCQYMESLETKKERVLQRRKAVIRDAKRARNLDRTKLFSEALNFVEEGLEIARKRGTILQKQ